MIHATDEQLIERALRGDRGAAQTLIERYRRMVAGIAFNALGNADDASDVAQETLMYALQRLTDLRDGSRFAGWLHNITLSRCADYRRRRGTRRLGEPITILNERSEEIDYTERLAIRSAMAHLSEAHRTTLLLHYEGGWSLKEVATLLTIPVNTVRSRLMAAKRQLRADLLSTFDNVDQETTPLNIKRNTKRKPMLTEPNTLIANKMAADKRIDNQNEDNMKGNELAETYLTDQQTALLAIAYPGARVLSTQYDPEPWMPFTPRVRIALANGTEKTVDFRGDIDAAKEELFAALERLGIPCPRLIHSPVLNTDVKGYSTLCEAPRGDNLLLWALGGTPHRIRLATERAFESIDRLQGITQALRADPVGAKLPQRTLTDEIDLIMSDEKWNADPWLAEAGADIAAWRIDPWFVEAIAKVREAAADIKDPLVFTNYLHFFPNFVRIQPSDQLYNEPLGWPGDVRYDENPITEFVAPHGHFGDPLLGLAMVWVYDCYPFVHTGFVEQFLWRRGISRREFAPRLAIKALQMIARDLPVERPAEGGYWDGLHGWAEQALSWI